MRLLAAALTGPLSRSPVHAAQKLRQLWIGGLAPGTPMAYDGEVATAPRELLVDKAHEALTVYRPQALLDGALPREGPVGNLIDGPRSHPAP